MELKLTCTVCGMSHWLDERSAGLWPPPRRLAVCAGCERELFDDPWNHWQDEGGEG